MTATTSGWFGLAPRDSAEPHRAATPLELLFDLTVVVAVAQAAAELHHALSAGDVVAGAARYTMVFFAIWWAWMNFTWFASAYDRDDVTYRLLTLVQLGGALLIAAGIPAAFEHTDFRTVTVGYTVMRVALVVQWLRAAAGDPVRRPVALAYAAGITVVQLGWLARLLLPHPDAPPALVAFLLLVAAEIAVPVVAERRATSTAWHPGHIAERYSLFTLIVLGECILACTVTLQRAVTDVGLSVSAVVVAVSSVLVVFCLWWVYFEDDVAAGLRTAPQESFRWGYAHFAVFAGVAAVGAGLQVAAEHVTATTATDSAGSGQAPEAAHGIGALGVGLSVAVPVAVVLVVLAALHNRLDTVQVPVVLWAGSGLVVLGCGLAATAVPVTVSVAGTALVCVAVVVVKVVARSRPDLVYRSRTVRP
ncbi:low temperature requirement protein A [Kineosporia sp. A_224]|uniref:low temperature requirement protein A n=1 Tax=Kineosporia sp. A_224 TaxID=1962180 RepID=UPI000B4B1B5B|nr:low temperature requirement protein A [Kineosporia sp. A_224]